MLSSGGIVKTLCSVSGPPTGWPIIHTRHTDDEWPAVRWSVAGRVGHAARHQTMSLWHGRSAKDVQLGGLPDDNEHCYWPKGTTEAHRSHTDYRLSSGQYHYSVSVATKG